MNRQYGAALAGALALTALAPYAAAQTAGAAASPLTAPGPALSGVCVLSEQGMVAGSLVGKSVAARIQQLAQVADSEVNSQVTALQSDEKTFENARTSFSTEQQNQKIAEFQGRERDVQRLAQQRSQELEATRQKRLNEVVSDALPMIREAVQQHNCSIVVEAGSTLTFNPAMDLTPSVIQGLNAKITQMTFEREHLDASSGGAAH
jgi:Skp family chaperone for outer membrane proteins